jgi:hypothetical protein
MKPLYVASLPILSSQCGWQCHIRYSSRNHLFDIPWVNKHSSLEMFYKKHQFTSYNAEYTGVIPGAIVVGPGILITPDSLAIFRDLSTSFNDPMDRHWLLSQQFNSLTIEKESKDVWLVATLGGNSYYHWLLEEVPRLVTAISKGAKLIYASNFSPNLSVILETFNFSGDIIHPSRAPIGLRFNNVYYQSLYGESGKISPELPTIMRRIGDVVVKHIPLLNGYPERIYISRRSKRRLLNEDEIFDHYLIKFGFVRIFLEDIPFIDQVKLFRHASIVIGIHGAGLANIVFMSERSIFIEILNSNYMHWCYWHLALHCNLNYYPVVNYSADLFDHGLQDGDSDFELPLDSLTRLFDKLCIS